MKHGPANPAACSNDATSVAEESIMNLVFVFSREHEDRALMSLAAVLHHSKHNLDSVVLLHSAIDVNNEQSVYHFLLGNIYSVSKHLSVICVQKCM